MSVFFPTLLIFGAKILFKLPKDQISITGNSITCVMITPINGSALNCKNFSSQGDYYTFDVVQDFCA